MDLRSMRFQDLSNQQAQLSISKHRYRSSGRNLHLIENLARGCQRLHKHGVLRSNPSRHTTQIPLWQRQEISKCARMLHNSKNRALRAMTSKTSLAPLAFFTSQIDLANY